MKMSSISSVTACILLICCIFGGVCAANTSVAGSSAKDLFDKGNQSLQQGKYEDAIASFDQAIEQQPDYADAYFKKGGALFLSGKFGDAMDAYQNATRIDPKLGDAWAQIGNLDLFVAQPALASAALEAYQKATELLPNDPGILINQGIAYFITKDDEKAISSLEKAIAADAKTARAWFWKGVALDDSKKYNESLEAYTKAVEIDPTYKDAWFAKGMEEAFVGKFDEGVKSLQKFIDVKGNSSEPFNISTANESSAYYQMGIIQYTGLNQTAEAEKSFTKAVELNPKDHNSLYYLGRIQYDNGDYSGAASSLQKAIDAKDQFANAYLWLGKTDMQLKNRDGAMEAFKNATEMNPNLSEGWYNLGGLLGDAGDYEDAAGALDKAVQINPNMTEAWMYKGMNLYSLNQTADAIDALERATSDTTGTLSADDQAQAYHILGLAEYGNDDLDGSLKAFNQSVALNASSPGTWNDYGTALNDKKQYEEALNAFNKAIEIDATSAPYVFNKANALANLNKTEEAIVSYDKAISLQPTTLAYLRKAEIQMKNKQYEPAIETLNAGIAQQSTNADLYGLKASSLMNLGRYDEALDAVTKALEIDPEWAVGKQLKDEIDQRKSGSSGSGNLSANSSASDDFIISNLSDSKASVGSTVTPTVKPTSKATVKPTATTTVKKTTNTTNSSTTKYPKPPKA